MAKINKQKLIDLYKSHNPKTMDFYEALGLTEAQINFLVEERVERFVWVVQRKLANMPRTDIPELENEESDS